MFGALAGQVSAGGLGADVAPVIIFDQRVAYTYLQNIGSQVNQPVVEANLHLEGTNVVALVGQVGRLLNLDATLIYLGAQLQTFRDGEVPLVIQEAAPKLLDVSSQADAEKADIAREKFEIDTDPAGEERALANIYARRGVPMALALQVASALHKADALAAHTRDELGISAVTEAQPLTAAAASALAFSLGAALPLGMAALVPANNISLWVTVVSLVFLAALGAVGAKAGGAPMLRAVLRVTFWGAVAMAVTALVGKLFGAVV